MKKYLLIALGAGLMFFLGSCKDDDADPDAFVGTWTLSTVTYQDFPEAYNVNNGATGSSFYGEESYTLQFTEGLNFERDIVKIPSFGSINDEGTYVNAEGVLTLNSLTGDTFVGIHNFFNIIEGPDATEVLLETNVTLNVVSNEIWNDPLLGGALDLTDQDAVSAFYTEYAEPQSAKARLAFTR